MTIGYLVPEFPLQTHIFFWREIETIREMGIGVHLISTRRPAEGSCKHEFAARAAGETHYVFPPPIHRMPSALLRVGSRITNAMGYLRGLRESSWREEMSVAALLPSAVNLVAFAQFRGIGHIHGHSCAQAAHLLALCHALGGPSYSLMLHGNLAVYGKDHRSKMRAATFVAAAGGHLVRELTESADVEPSRILITGMGVDTQYHLPPACRSGRPGRLVMLTVARLNACKGHVYALQAMRRAVSSGADLHYLVAGGDEHGYEREIRREVTRLDLGKRVQMLGTLKEEQILSLMQEADVFVLPSIGLGEAWPVSIMEAMACGMPVIASRIGSTPDMIEHEKSGLLVEQRDEISLAQAMLRLSEDLEFRAQLGSAARARAVQAFDVRMTARRLLDRILGGQGVADAA